MTSISLPNPVIRPSGPAKADVDALERDLRRQVDGEVRFDAGSRAAYSTDASNYRQVPIGVVVPRTVEAGAAAVEVCRRHGAPVVSRGGGTSLAGQTCNVAVVIDWSKYCHGLVSVDPAARTAIVEPGIVLDELNAKLAEHKLMLKLVPVPAARTLVVLGYPDIASAADATPHIAPHQPEQLEGVDERLITFERERRMNPKALHLLPEGHGWLMVIFAGGSKDDADAKACAASRSARSAPRRRPPPTTPSSPPWPGWPQAPSRSSPRCSAVAARQMTRNDLSACTEVSSRALLRDNPQAPPPGLVASCEKDPGGSYPAASVPPAEARKAISYSKLKPRAFLLSHQHLPRALSGSCQSPRCDSGAVASAPLSHRCGRASEIVVAVVPAAPEVTASPLPGFHRRCGPGPGCGAPAAGRHGRAQRLRASYAQHMTETSDAFGTLLRRLRTDAGLTQEELAAAARISVRTISDLERNVNQTARKDTARLLARALNLTGPAAAAFEAVALGRAPASSFLAAGGPADRAAGARRALPRDTVSFTGREAELERLVAAAAQTSGVAVIHAIGGMAGVGKTTLAVHAAHQLAPRFPDGQLFLPLHGHTPGQLPVDPENALASLLLTTGVPAAQIPPGLAARTALWRDRVAGQRLLLLLDDASGSDQVRPLLPGSPGSLVLITSRRHLTALEDAHSISLDVLPPDEAAQLLIRLAARPELSAADAAAPEAVPDAVPELTRLAGYLPLAIGMLARQLHHHPAWTPADLAADLSAERDRLSLLATEHLSVAAAFDLSYRDLSVGQQQLFRRLGLHPGPDIDVYAAAALDDTDLASARRLLTALYDHYLLTEPARGRYRLHDLIREHARALAAADPPGDRDGAIGALLSYYLATAQAADRHLALRPVAAPAWPLTAPAPAHAPELATPELATPELATPELATAEQASAWMEAERLNLHAVFGHAVTHGPPGYVAAMSAAMNGFLRVQHWDEATALHQGAAEVARQAGDEYAEAEALTDLAHIQDLTADFAAATVNLTRAIGICERIGYRPAEALARHELGVVERLTGHYRAAADELNRALGLYRGAGDSGGSSDSGGSGDLGGVANTLYELGLVQYRTGDLKAATASLTEALETYRRAGHRRGEAWTLNMLGVMQYQVGDYATAAVSLRQALELQQRAGNRLGEANTTYELGTVHRLTGDYAAAVAIQQRALELYRDFGYRRGEANVLTELGTVHRLTSDYETAADHQRQALELYLAVSDRLGEGIVFKELGICQQLSGELREAGVSLARSLQLFRDLGEQINEGEVLNCLGDLALACARTGEARAHFTEALTIATSAATPPEEARAREGIGLCHLRDGDLPLAAEWLHRALEIYQRLGSPAAERVRQVLREHHLGS